MKGNEQEAKRLQALAHPTRLHILKILAHSPACVCDLVMLTGKRQPYISQQLIILSGAHLVTAERAGRRIFYHLNTDEVEAAIHGLQPLCQTESTAKRNNTCGLMPKETGVERDAL